MLSRLFSPAPTMQPVEIPKRTIAEIMTGFDCDEYGSKAVHLLAIHALEGARNALTDAPPEYQALAPIPAIVTHIAEGLRYNHKESIIFLPEQVDDLRTAIPALEEYEDRLTSKENPGGFYIAQETRGWHAHTVNLLRGLAVMITSDYPPLVAEHAYDAPKGPAAGVLKHS